jgi:hypothetical protein
MTVSTIFGVHLLGERGLPIGVENTRLVPFIGACLISRLELEMRLEDIYSPECSLFAPYLMLNIGYELLSRIESWGDAGSIRSYLKTQWEIFTAGRTYIRAADDYVIYSKDLERLSKSVKDLPPVTGSDSDEQAGVDLERMQAMADLLYLVQHDAVFNLNRALNQYWQHKRGKKSVWHNPWSWTEERPEFDQEMTRFWPTLTSFARAMIKIGVRLVRRLEEQNEDYAILRTYRPTSRSFWFWKTTVKSDPFRDLTSLSSWGEFEPASMRPERLKGILVEDENATWDLQAAGRRATRVSHSS